MGHGVAKYLYYKLLQKVGREKLTPAERVMRNREPMDPPKSQIRKKPMKESVDPVEQAIINVLDNNLDDMRTNVYQALSMLAAERLEEKKIEIADSYFGQK